MPVPFLLFGSPSAVSEGIKLFDIAEIATGLFGHEYPERDVQCAVARGIEAARR